MLVPVDLFIFLCYQNDLEYHCVLMSQEAFIRYDQIITNSVGSVYLELVLPQVCLVYHYFLFDLLAWPHIQRKRLMHLRILRE
jgi:hypothetical protein